MCVCVKQKWKLFIRRILWGTVQCKLNECKNRCSLLLSCTRTVILERQVSLVSILAHKGFWNVSFFRYNRYNLNRYGMTRQIRLFISHLISTIDEYLYYMAQISLIEEGLITFINLKRETNGDNGIFFFLFFFDERYTT